jgi:hypothetical protein
MVRVRLAHTMNPRPTYMGEPRLLCHIMPPLLFVGIKKGAKSFVTFVISHFIPNLFFFSEGMQIVSVLEAMNSYVGMHLPYALPCTNSQLLEERTICMFGRFHIKAGHYCRHNDARFSKFIDLGCNPMPLLGMDL